MKNFLLIAFLFFASNGQTGTRIPVAMLDIPGLVITMAGPCPSGTLAADGSSFLKAQHPKLFAAIGTSHGSIDSTHFNIPDYRGLFLRGVDGDAGNDPDKATRTAMGPGGNIGNLTGSIQSSENKAHSHGLPTSSITWGGALGPEMFQTIHSLATGSYRHPQE